MYIQEKEREGHFKALLSFFYTSENREREINGIAGL